mmetsp:Transcript_25904/g.39207  ORF Transcript_25904/g.39207 Transcript_25904/m.39207 type:complete len:227 (-) Transcript_25904:214-894(-)
MGPINCRETSAAAFSHPAREKMNRIAGRRFFRSTCCIRALKDGTSFLISRRSNLSLSRRSSRALRRRGALDPRSCRSNKFSRFSLLTNFKRSMAFSIRICRLLAADFSNGLTSRPIGIDLSSINVRESLFCLLLRLMSFFSFLLVAGKSGMPSPRKPKSPFGLPGPASGSRNKGYRPRFVANKYLRGTGRLCDASTRTVFRPVTYSIHSANCKPFGKVADRQTICE